MKTCFKCGGEKPIEDFYRHPQMGDGHLGKCKLCTRRDVRERAIAKADRITAEKREYAKLPHVRARMAVYTKAYRRRHPERMRAHNAAARDGSIQKASCCSRCQRQRKLEKHHPDYSQPRLIVWLCKPCHAVADRERRAAESLGF